METEDGRVFFFSALQARESTDKKEQGRTPHMLRLQFELRDGATVVPAADAYIYVFQGNTGAPGVRIQGGSQGTFQLLPPDHAGPLCMHIYRMTREDAASETDIQSAFAAIGRKVPDAVETRVLYSSGRSTLATPTPAPTTRAPRKRFETRLGGVHIDTSAVYALASREDDIVAPAAAAATDFEFRIVDDALESMLRTASVGAASRPPSAYLRYQKEFTMRVTLHVAAPFAPAARHDWRQTYHAQWLAREKRMLERHSQQASVRAAAEFIQHYVRAFAPFDSADAQPKYDKSFASSAARPAHDILRFYMSEARLRSPSGTHPLTPRVARVLPMHMPTATAPHGIMPLGLFHFRTLLLSHEEASEATARFGSEFARILEQQCVAAGLGGGDAFRRAVDAVLLPSPAPPSRPDEDNKDAQYVIQLQQFYMACDALGMACAEICTHVKYRADFSYLRTGRTVTVERQDVDAATGASGSGDCEDVAAAAQCIIHAILRGPLVPVADSGLRDPYEQHPVWKKLVELLSGTHLLRPWGPTTNLRAAQLLLCHFAPCVVLGSVTDAFPGASRIVKSGIYTLDVDEQERLLDATRDRLLRRHHPATPLSPAKHVALSAAAADVLGDEKLPLGTFVYDSAVNNDVAPVAHQFVVLMPLDACVDMWLAAMKQPPVSAPFDAIVCARLREMRDVFLRYRPIANLALPALLVEGTARVSPYLVGASVFMEQTAALLAQNGMPHSARRLRRHIDDVIVPRERDARQWRGKLLRRSAWPTPAEEARFPAAPKLHTRDAHHMRILKTSIPDRRGSIFYRDALHISCPWIMTWAAPTDVVTECIKRVHAGSDTAIPGTVCQYLDSMTMAIVDKETSFWGVPLERLLRANRDAARIGQVALRPVIGREVPLDLRVNFYTHAFDSVLPYAPPIQFGHVHAPTVLDEATVLRAADAAAAATWRGLLALDSVARIVTGDEFESLRTLIISAEDAAPSTGLADLLSSAAWDRAVKFLDANKYVIVQMCYASHGQVVPYVPAVLTIQVARRRTGM